MVTHTKPDIDFSTFPESDGEPMAETYANAIQMVDLQYSLRGLLARQGRARVAVGGNQFVYYNRHNGRENVSPDVYVVFDVASIPPPKWQTWVEGKFPDIVFEITSPSTQDVDLSAEPRGKLRLYAAQGAREYYIYDPQQEMDPVFRGYELREGHMEPLPRLPSGGIMSPLLGAELRPMDMGAMDWRPAGTWLRVINPTSGQPIPIADEEQRDLQVARGELTETRGELTETRGELTGTREELTGTREELTETREELTTARDHLTLEAQARRAAEERAARAEAALQALLAEQAGRQIPTSDDENEV